MATQGASCGSGVLPVREELDALRAIHAMQHINAPFPKRGDDPVRPSSWAGSRPHNGFGASV